MTSQNRRSFLATLGAAALGCATGSAPAAAAFGTGAPGTRRLDRIGLQLYTVRDAAAKDLPGTLARIAQIGFRDVEFAGYHGRTAQEIRDLLSRNGLRAPSSHIPVAELSGDKWKKTLDDATTIGHEYLTIPWLGDAQRGSIEDWKRTASLFNTRAFDAKGAGLKFAYHNHDFEFRTVGGLVPMDVLITETDPTLVSFEMDLYWVVRAGRDPIEYLTRFPNRFSMFHAKDSAGPPDHRMVEVGAGVIDFRRILAEGQRIGVRHVFVEHDNPADPFASVTSSYRYLSQLTF